MKYTKEELEKIYDNNPNLIAKMFLNAGYREDYVIGMFNDQTKDAIITQAQKISEILSKEVYHIKEKYKKAELPFLQDDRNHMYEIVNNKIDKITGETLQQLYDYESDKYIIGIHRTASLPEEIFSKGIKFDSDNDYTNHVQKMDNFVFMLAQIMYCEDYKLSRGVFIIKLPKSSVEKNNENAYPIYYKANDGKLYLRPEFVCAYVPVNNKILGNVIFNNHNYDNLYDQTTEFFLDESVENNLNIN
ncbi:MAG: hypothetical protein J6J17_01820 [Bacilli bacterium]|nr:hypothetical protein [Bacilli bacterium]